MAKRTKENTPAAAPPKKEKPFHSPFADLAQKARREAEEAARAQEAERAQKEIEAKLRAKEARKREDDARIAVARAKVLGTETAGKKAGAGAGATGKSAPSGGGSSKGRDKASTPARAAPVAPERSRLFDQASASRDDEGDDMSLFLRAVQGARAIPETERAVVPRAPTPPREAPQSEEIETMARLADLCAGSGDFDLADTTEYIEGTAPGVDRHLVRRLRKGDFSVQAHLDLHGMTRDEARTAVDTFLARAQSSGLRCVLLVHGRGKNSKDNIPVLKQSVGGWLQRGRMAKLVLAFATARPHDGGAGAIYVLLRR